MSKPFGEGSLKMKAIKVKFLTAVLIVVLSFSLIDLCHGEKNRLMTASVDVGRAKAKISAEEMLKLHRKRRDENDKLFSINSPRKNDPENQVNGDIFFIICYIKKRKITRQITSCQNIYLILFYRQRSNHLVFFVMCCL